MSLIASKLPSTNKLFGAFWLCFRNCSKFVKETRIITQAEVDRFAEISGDHNTIHKATHPIEKRCIHGALLNALVSGIIGTKLPGPGCIVISQEFKFPNKCTVDKEIEMLVRLVEDRKIMKVAFIFKQSDSVVFEGTAKLINLRPSV